jgi:hypothetical protein
MKLSCSSSPHWGSLQCCARLCGIEWPRSTEPLSLLACPPAVVLATCHRDIQRCLPSSRHIDSPFHFFDTITAPGRANLRSSHQPDQRPFLFLLFVVQRHRLGSRPCVQYASLACVACLHRLQLLDDKHTCVYFLSSPAASHSHILQPISHTIRIIRDNNDHQKSPYVIIAILSEL